MVTKKENQNIALAAYITQNRLLAGVSNGADILFDVGDQCRTQLNKPTPMAMLVISRELLASWIAISWFTTNGNRIGDEIVTAQFIAAATNDSVIMKLLGLMTSSLANFPYGCCLKIFLVAQQNARNKVIPEKVSMVFPARCSCIISLISFARLGIFAPIKASTSVATKKYRKFAKLSLSFISLIFDA